MTMYLPALTRTQSPTLPLTVEVIPSIRNIDHSAWIQLDADPLQGYDHYAALEDRALPGVEFRYFVVRAEKRIVAVAPAYRQTLKLSSLLHGPHKQAFGAGLSLRVMAIGSPVAETCSIPCAPDWLANTPVLLAALSDALQSQARHEGAWIYLFKDVASERVTLRSALNTLGFGRISGMPTHAQQVATDHYFRHRSPIITRLLRWAAGKTGIDQVIQAPQEDCNGQ